MNTDAVPPIPQAGLDAEPALPENYPFHYTRDLEIKGHQVRFRPIHPGDNHRMVMLFDTFSMETIYHRFFSYVRMPPERVKRFTHVDYALQMALVAEEERHGQKHIMGVARYAREKDNPAQGEMAIVVGDRWQGRGIGTELLKYLFEVAEKEGVAMLYGLVHFDNRAAPRIIRKSGIKFKKKDNGTEWRFEVFPGQTQEPEAG
jgi:acetyltransferase